MTACHNIINSCFFFLFQSNDFKQKLFWKGRNIRNIHFDDTKVQLLPFIKGKQKFLLLFENSITSFMIFERTYQIISRSCIISYISGMSSTWLSLGQNIYNTVFYIFWETFLSINKHFLCKQVHVIIWKSWGIRKIERGELGLNKILKDFKLFYRYRLVIVHTTAAPALYIVGQYYSCSLCSSLKYTDW